MSKQTKRDLGIPGLTLRVSWADYWRAFIDEHGETGDWAMWGGRFWFRDGWSHSATDHKGPEFPPPEDQAQLRAAQERYWQGRRKAALKQLERMTLETEQALAMVKARPGLLKVVQDDTGKDVTPLRNVIRDLEHTVGEGMPGAGLTVKVSKRVNLTEAGLGLLLRDRLERVKMVIEECDQELKELGRGRNPDLGQEHPARPVR